MQFELITFFSFLVHGAELNKSYLENNKSDLSIGDVSTWFHGKASNNPYNSMQERKDHLPSLAESSFVDTDLQNFKDLLHQVKEIMDGRWNVATG